MSNGPEPTEEQNQKIDPITGGESRGSGGSGREDLSGENPPQRRGDDYGDDLADNRPSGP